MSLPIASTWYDAPDPASILTYEDYGRQIFDMLDFLTKPPIVHVVSTGAQTYLNNTWTFLQFQRVIIDTDGFFDPAVPGQVLPTIPGWYKGWYGVGWNTAALAGTGMRFNTLTTQNPTVLYDTLHRRGTDASFPDIYKGIRFEVPLTGNQAVQIQVKQDTGNTMSQATASIEQQSELFLRWWKPL